MESGPDRRAQRVCILLHLLARGGIETAMIILCRRLLAAGCEVDLLRLGRADQMLLRVPEGVRTMLLQEAALRPGKTASGANAGPVSAPGAEGMHSDLPEWRRRLARASDIASHIRDVSAQDGLQVLRRIWRPCWRAIIKRERRKETLSIVRCVVQLSRYIEQTKPDVLYAAGRISQVAALLTRRITAHRPRLVISFHGSAHAGAYQGASSGEHALLPALLPEADAVHAVSAGLADEVAQTCNIRRETVTVLHNPAFHNDIPDLKQRQAPHPWIARKGGEKIILWAGSGLWVKDLKLLLRAFRILSGRRKARLILLGVPQKQGGEMARRLAGDVKDRVLCPGFVDNPFAWMAGADAFVLCSRSEGFGNVLVEAMACGCPVVSTDCPHGPREILEDGRWGRLTPPGDAEALAAAIDATLENPPAAEDLVARARDFSEDIIIPRFMEMLGVLHPAAGALPAAETPSVAAPPPPPPPQLNAGRPPPAIRGPGRRAGSRRIAEGRNRLGDFPFAANAGSFRDS